VHQIHGLRRFYLKEDVPAPEDQMLQLLQKGSPDWFHDVRLANAATKNVVACTNEIYFRDILTEANFHAYVATLTKQSSRNKSEQQQPASMERRKRKI